MSDAPDTKTNAEVRAWYLGRVARIPQLNKAWIKQGLPVSERAKAAWQIRYEARLQARAMMANPDEVELLRQRDKMLYGNPDGATFESLVERLKKTGFEGDEIYEAIIESSYRTDKDVNKNLGF